MDNDEALKIPAVGKRQYIWHVADDAPLSRSKRSKSNGPYESTVPVPLADLEFHIPAWLGADAEESVNALARFDEYAASLLGEGNHVLGPMSTVLLRTEATSSSQIEHLTVGAKNLALETLHEGSSENAAIVVGNVRAMETALAFSENMTQASLLAMHRALLLAQEGWQSYAGRYRDSLVWGGTNSYSPVGASHVAPQADLVPELMEDLFAFIQRDDLPVIVQCAVAHAQFETIHPFADGNGRCGRALVHAILRNKAVVRNTTAPVSAGLLHNTQDYFDALTAYRTGDAGPIVERFAEACRFAATSGCKLIDAGKAELDAARQALSGVRSDAAAWKILPQLIAQPIVNTQYLQTALGLSKSQAERAVATLAQHGVLTARSSSRRSVVWECRAILDILDDYAASLRRG